MFQSARLRLTLWYLAIIMLISIVFSTTIYSIVSRQIEGFIRLHNERIERFRVFRKPEPPFINTDELLNQKKKLLFSLIVTNFGILIVAGLAGYFLSGRTLKPIKLMVDEQNQFITNSSHELRTPIANLRAEMEGSLLEKHLTDKRTREIIKSNLEEVKHLENLINNLLRIAQIHNSDVGKYEANISILEIIKTAQKKINSLAKQKNIKINTKVNDQIIKGDKISLVELFVIILDNAIKYSPRNTTVTITSENTKNAVKILVSDQGIGLSKKDLPHIFERFYRADKSRSQVEGYGLGLSIAKKIVEIHNGSIFATNNKDGGLTFSIRLPVNLV